MSTLNITYAGSNGGNYAFHDTGVPQYGHGMQPANSASPRKYVETFRIKHRFFEETFADNEARWSEIKRVLRENPRGLLTITDERGHQIDSRQVRFNGIDGTEEWGQYRREITVTFDAIGGTLTVNAQCGAFTPTGRTQIILPNIESMAGTIKTERPTTHTNIRREQIKSTALSGKWTASPDLTLEQRRDALLAKKAEIEGINNAPDGVLVWGTYTETVQIENASCDIGDGSDELTWSLSAFSRIFPDGEYAEADYEATYSDDIEENMRTLTVAGKVVADTRGHAESAALAIKASFAGSRQFLGQELRRRVLDGTDGSDDCVELTFSYRFREVLGSIISYKLKVRVEYDAKAGDVTTTYSGTVVALDAATAMSKARDLGSGKEGGTLYLMQSTEETDSTGVDDVVMSIAVDFSYTYLGKSPIEFAEVTFETNTDYFGANTLSINGSVTAATESLALAFARKFKITGKLEKSIKEAPSKLQKGNSSGAFIGYNHLNRVEFSYVYASNAVRNTATYGKETVNDFDSRETTVSFSGVAYGPSESACNTVIDAITTLSLAGSRKSRSQRTPSFEFDSTNNVSVLTSVSFSETYRAPLSVSDGIDILEARYSIARNFGVSAAVIDEVPGGHPFVQPDVRWTCGSITVSGSIKVVATAESTARSWARGLKGLCTGYLEQAEESPDYTYNPRSNTSVQSITFGFSYASKDPNLYVNF